MRAVARQAYLAALEVSGNPSSIHRDGQRARAILEDAREIVSSTLNCDPIEVIFTSGGTESVNLGIIGLYRARRSVDPRRTRIIVPEGEHHATLDALEWLEAHESAVIDWVLLDTLGRIDLTAWRDALTREPETIAVATSLWANNEVGTIHDVDALAAACAAAEVPFHVDAIAAWGHIPVGLSPGISALSVAGHKVGSVPGVGVLVVPRSVTIDAVLHGGGQQRGIRSGTQNPAVAASLAAAIGEAHPQQDGESERLAGLRDDAQRRILASTDGVRVSGDLDNRLPHNLHLHIEDASSADLLYLLDEAGISVSAGSACQAGVARASHVLLAMGRSPEQASSALRISLGHTTTQADIDELVRVFPEVVSRARTVSSRA